MSAHHHDVLRAHGGALARLRRKCLDRDDRRCTEPGCGSPLNLALHHDVPVSVDPSRALDPTNTRIVCGPCHVRLHAGGRDPERAAWRRLLWESI